LTGGNNPLDPGEEKHEYHAFQVQIDPAGFPVLSDFAGPIPGIARIRLLEIRLFYPCDLLGAQQGECLTEKFGCGFYANG
jgi:hypothetical protein